MRTNLISRNPSNFSALLLVFAASLGLSTFPLRAADLSDLTWTSVGGEITITHCDGSASGSLDIPATIGGNPITSIGDGAFRSCWRLTSIMIPSSVTAIGERAFEGCRRLTDITVRAGNVSYNSRDGVLFNAALTQLIKYPAGKSGTHYSIPSSVTSIGASPFAGCDSLISATIPDSVTAIDDEAFYQGLNRGLPRSRCND